MNHTPPKQRLGLPGKLGLVILGLALALSLGEVAARSFLGRVYAEDNGNQWQCERALGWRGKPNLVTSVNTEGYVHPVARNATGMHEGDHAWAKPDGVFRILVLGDSFIEARQVAEAETSASRLEQSLNASAPPEITYEVISAGASAWGPAQELLYFQTEGRRYRPDLVLIFWYPANDLQDVLPDHRMTFEGVNCYAPYFAVCDGRFDAEPWFSAPGLAPTYATCSTAKKTLAGGLNWLYHHSRLYQHLEPVLIRGKPKIKYAYDFSPWLAGITDETLAYAFQVTGGIYTQLAQEAAQAGAKTAFVVIPLKQAIYYELGSPYREQIEAEYPDLKQANPRRPNEWLSQAMAPAGAPVLDLQPDFVEHLRAGGGTLYWSTESHWNVPGNRFAGEQVARWLIEQQLVTPGK